MFRTRPHVLFFTEKWCRFEPSGGFTNSFHNLFGSLRSSGLASSSFYFYDESSRKTEALESLYSLAQDTSPDIIFTSLNAWGDYVGTSTILGRIKRELSTLLVMWWSDTLWGPTLEPHTQAFYPFADLHIAADSLHTYSGTDPRYITLLCPQDIRLCYDSSWYRDIDVSFVGSVAQHYKPGRSYLIEILRKEVNANIYQSGGQLETRLSAFDYFSTMKRSKISLNINNERGKSILKSRFLEIALCGSLVLSDVNPEFYNFFTPGVEFVEFTDERDVVKKVEYYLGNSNERMKIASNGYRKAMENHNSIEYWDKVFSNVPQLNSFKWKSDVSLSVIVQVIHGEGFLEGLFNDLRAQSFQDFELILVLNNPSSVEEHMISHYTDNLKVRAVKPPLDAPNLGISNAVTIAKSNYVSLLPLCSELKHPYLQEHVQLLENNPDVSFILDDCYCNQGSETQVFRGYIEKPKCLHNQLPRVTFRRAVFEVEGIWGTVFKSFLTDRGSYHDLIRRGYNFYSMPSGPATCRVDVL